MSDFDLDDIEKDLENLGGEVSEESLPEDSVEITFDDLKEMIFSPGDIFFNRKNKKPLKLFSAGATIDRQRLNKFEGQSGDIQIKKVIDPINIHKGKKLFLLLRDSNESANRVYCRKIILKWFYDIYWFGREDGSLLDLVHVGENSFYLFDEEMTERLLQFGEDYYLKASLSAMFNVILCMTFGYLEFNFLSDVFHLSFLLDGNLDDKYSWTIAQALEKESQSPGSGLNYLENLNLKHEHDLLKMSGNQNIKTLKENFGNYFNDPNILRFVSVHHEKVNGEGFPKGVCEDELSEMENVILFVQLLLNKKINSFSEGDGKAFLKKCFEDFMETHKYSPFRVMKMLDFLIDEIDADEELKEVGT